jgi:co-chaperonin GroES (HSP10)
MSELILPERLKLKPTVEVIEQITKPPEKDEEKATLLPTPSGYRLLCSVPQVSKKIDGTELDLERPDFYAKQEEHATTVLFVLKVGPDAYADKTKFPSGPWCKEGDFIMVRTYAGTRFKIYGNEFRFINDDQVDGVVDDPRGITRA